VKTGSALAAVMVIWSRWPGVGPVAAGLVVGVMIAVRPAFAAKLFRPARDLLAKLPPLLLPVLVIVMAGAIQPLSWPLRIVIGLIVGAVGWAWIVAPALETDAAGRQAELKVIRLVPMIAFSLFLTVLVLILVGAGIVSGASWYDGIGFAATALFTLAFALWVLSGIVLLASYATTTARIVVVAGLGVALAAEAGRHGLIWGDGSPLGIPGWVFFAIAGLALAVETARSVSGVDLLMRGMDATLGRAVTAARDAIPPLRRIAERADAVGLGIAVLASVVLAVAVMVSLVATGDQGEEGRPKALRAYKLENGPAPSPFDQLLADAYVPTLAFTEHERWAPISVESYLSHAGLGEAVMSGPASVTEPTKSPPVCDVENLRTPCRPQTVDRLPRSCPGLADSPCFRLTIDCATGDEPCANGHGAKADPGERPAVYARVIRKETEPNVFKAVGPYRKDLAIIVQYWFFYRYDEWTQTVLGGRLTQRHESDWEAITIGLSARKPLFAAYSSHCGGSWRGWGPGLIPAAPTARPWTHPLVAVAEGSQANYPRADQARAPEWESCSGLPTLTAGLASYASNIRDRTAYDRLWAPPRPTLVDASSPPMSFPGSWGRHDETVLTNHSVHPLGKPGGGPRTPSLQPLWQDPVGRIFCNTYWHGPPGVKRSCR
jgi:hypothetical protein